MHARKPSHTIIVAQGSCRQHFKLKFCFFSRCQSFSTGSSNEKDQTSITVCEIHRSHRITIGTVAEKAVFSFQIIQYNFRFPIIYACLITHRLFGKLLAEEILEGVAVFSELLDPLVQLVERHLVLEKGPTELRLVVDVGNLLMFRSAGPGWRGQRFR